MTSAARPSIPPPNGYTSWIAYAVEAMQTRQLYYDHYWGNQPQWPGNVEREDMNAAAVAELAQLRDSSWAACPGIERIDRTWVFAGTRVPVANVFEALGNGSLMLEEWHACVCPQVCHRGPPTGGVRVRSPRPGSNTAMKTVIKPGVPEIAQYECDVSFAFVGEPETNGVVERFNRTLKEQIIHGRTYRNRAELSAAVSAFTELYNREWRLEKLRYKSPLEARRDFTQSIPLAA